MLALLVSRPGPICDGIVALLRSRADIRKVVQVEDADAAWDIAQKLCPDITVIYSAPLSPDLTDFTTKVKTLCKTPLLIIVTDVAERETAVSHEADVVVVEGVPSSRLNDHISALLQQNSETTTVEKPDVKPK